MCPKNRCDEEYKKILKFFLQTKQALFEPWSPVSLPPLPRVFSPKISRDWLVPDEAYTTALAFAMAQCSNDLLTEVTLTNKCIMVHI
jgi:hypothetical protein